MSLALKELMKSRKHSRGRHCQAESYPIVANRNVQWSAHFKIRRNTHTLYRAFPLLSRQLTLYHVQTNFDLSTWINNCWTHCDKRKNCLWWHNSHFTTMFLIIFNCYTFIYTSLPLTRHRWKDNYPEEFAFFDILDYLEYRFVKKKNLESYDVERANFNCI